MHGQARPEAPPPRPAADPFALGSDVPVEPYGDGYGPVFEASYPGECAECYDPIDEGDRIQADGSGGYVHEECACA